MPSEQIPDPFGQFLPLVIAGFENRQFIRMLAQLAVQGLFVYGHKKISGVRLTRQVGDRLLALPPTCRFDYKITVWKRTAVGRSLPWRPAVDYAEPGENMVLR
jgi:hypothetical protein